MGFLTAYRIDGKMRLTPYVKTKKEAEKEIQTKPTLVRGVTEGYVVRRKDGEVVITKVYGGNDAR